MMGYFFPVFVFLPPSILCILQRKCTSNLILTNNEETYIPTLELELNQLATSNIGLCHYHISLENGYGALSIDLDGSKSGFYTDENGTFELKSEKGANLKKNIFKWNHDCQKTFFADPNPELFKLKHSDRVRRDTDDIRYIELIIVISQSLVLEHELGNATDNETKYRPVLKRYEEVHNMVDNFYKSVDLRVALLDIVLFLEKDYIKVDGKSSGSILEGFRKYKQSQKLEAKGAQLMRWQRVDNAQFIVPKGTFADIPTIGKAWMESLCGSQSIGVNEDHGTSPLAVGTTIAHEMAHNFGVSHDTDASRCPAGEACIMNPSYTFSRTMAVWSEGSKKRLREKKESWSCLQDIPPKNLLYGSRNCGNGLVERDEDCDCGENASDECMKCCDHKTCRYHEGKECSDTTGKCCKDCKLQTAGSVCRASRDDCDLPEYCDGIYSDCPANVGSRNGEKCEHSGRCLDGRCMKRSDQCKNFFGASAKVNEVCMEAANNRTGDKTGNCGEYYSNNYYRRENFYDCQDSDDYLCGKIQCEKGSAVPQQIEFRDVDVVTRPGTTCKYLDWSNSRGIAGTDSGFNTDRMALGTPCGEDSVCNTKYKNSLQSSDSISRCVPLSELWVADEWGSCPNNCNGQGKCNSRGNCHCEKGYGGADCSKRGYGGSVDSGPMIRHVLDENMVMYSAIFGAILIILVISALVAKFHFGRNFVEICYYQPCPGKSRAGQFSQPAKLTKTSSADPFNQSGRRPKIDNSGDNSNLGIYMSMTVVPKSIPEKNISKPPARPPKPTTSQVRANLTMIQPATDPFEVDWGSQAVIRPAPPPPKPPTPPKPDYVVSSAAPPAPLPKDYY